ncbi:MAG: GNAT family protein, partial [Balneolaceae bacterium]|nr:GNAT family protein [Balneolaceae bacterium]
LHFGFSGKGFELIYAKPLERNTASCRVLEKAGFRHTDTMPNDEPHTLKGDMLRIYEITSGEWHNQADTPELNCSYPRTDI